MDDILWFAPDPDADVDVDVDVVEEGVVGERVEDEEEEAVLAAVVLLLLLVVGVTEGDDCSDAGRGGGRVGRFPRRAARWGGSWEASDAAD